MTRSKLTLIVDGNWLLMSRFPIINTRYIDDATIMQEVKALMIKSINIVLKTFPTIDTIIFVSDGGSWRKDIPIPQSVRKSAILHEGESSEYKGNRKKDNDINWDLVFSEFNKFSNDLKAAGVSAFNEPGIEGDDWCWYWSRTLNKMGTNVIIWTKDRDITQLCSSDNNGCFTVVWNKQNGVFVKKDDDLTKFLLNPYFHANDEILNDIINRSIAKVEVVPEEVQVDKIIRGDAGDNILPVMTRTAKNGGERLYRPTKKQLPESLDIYSPDEVEDWAEALLATKQWSGHSNEDISQIMEHFAYNRQMVVLDEKSYPDNVMKVFHKYDTWMSEHPLCSNIDKAEASILAQKNDIQSILDDI